MKIKKGQGFFGYVLLILKSSHACPKLKVMPSLALSRPSAQTSTSPLVHHHLSIFPLLEGNSSYLPIIGEVAIDKVSKI